MFVALDFLRSEIPIAGRFVCVLSWLLCTAAHAQSLTEQLVVARALARPELTQFVDARVEAAQGRAISAGTRPNPQLIYLREQTYNSKGTGEDYLSLAQTIHLGGRYRLQREAGEARARARQQEGASTKVAIATEARLRFYECLYREQRVSALQDLLAQVAQALEIVRRREARGDAALYDKRRLEREHTTSVARIEAEQAHSVAAKHRLAALLGADVESLSLSGALLPPDAPAELDALRTASTTRPDLLALEAERAGATLDAKAAARSWVPELRLEAGYKGVGMNQGGRTDGFLAGGYLTLPLWDHGSGQRRASEGEARAIAAEKRLIEGQLGGELRGARTEVTQLRDAALKFRDSSAHISTDLVRMATAGYEGGELGLLELLDAYRSATEDELTTLDMELASRRALIELHRLTGAGLP